MFWTKSWKFEIGPAGTAFIKASTLGPEYDGTLWMGSARSFQQVGANGGSLDKEWLAIDNFAGSGQGNVYLIVRDFGNANAISLHARRSSRSGLGSRGSCTT